MDTLCIPTQSEDHALRLSQIDKMPAIYSGAEAVLVLDAELINTEIERPRLTAQLRARIAASVWMSRSWCYQEGRLPPRIAFQFRGTAVIVNKKSPRMFERSEPQVWTKFKNNASGLQTATNRESQATCLCAEAMLETAFTESMVARKVDIVTAWNELAGRSTTMGADLPLIMSNILGLQSAGLLNFETPEEMYFSIFLAGKSLPLSLMFNDGPRYNPTDNHRNRWLPISISANILTSVCQLQITHAHLSTCITGADKKTLSFYWTDTVLPWRTNQYLKDTSGNVFLLDESLDLDDDNFATDGYCGTCFIIERSSRKAGSKILRGACFYVRDKSEIFLWRYLRTI